MSLQIFLNVIYGIVALALIFAIYIGTGGRAWFGTHERPERIIGKRVVIHEFDGFTEGAGLRLYGKVVGFDGKRYRIDFETSTEEQKWTAKCAFVSHRHTGYPVSSATKTSLLAVGGSTDEGMQFIALINVA